MEYACTNDPLPWPQTTQGAQKSLTCKTEEKKALTSLGAVVFIFVVRLPGVLPQLCRPGVGGGGEMSASRTR
eukprot:scaffold210678_cov13-Prasinocladus_malaysianus.AAC.1